jgi:AMMECR1 domain-containing protein
MRRFLAALLLLAACSKMPPAAGPAPLSDAERQEILGVARQALTRYYRDGTEHRPPELSPALRRFNGRVVFLTFHLDGETRGCVSAARGDLAGSVVEATIQTAQDSRYVVSGVKGPDGKPVTLRPEEVDRVRLEVNLLRPYEWLEYRDPDSLRGEVEPGIHGVRLSKGKTGAFYLPYVGLEFEYDIAPHLRTLAQKAKLKPEGWKKDSRLWRFETENFIEDRPGGRALPLYRWNVLHPEPDLNHLERARTAAASFLQTLLQSGSLRLGYHPKRKEALGPAPSWLAVRTAAALYRMSAPQPSLAAVASDLLSAAERRETAERKPAPPATSSAKPAAPKPPGAPPPELAQLVRSEIAARAPAPGGPPRDPPAVSPVANLAHRVLALLARSQASGRGGLAQARPAADSLVALQQGGQFRGDAVAPGVPWEREHEDATWAVRALAAVARLSPGTGHREASRAILGRAALTYGDRPLAWADLILAAADLHRADEGGPWLDRARAWAGQLLELQFTPERAPLLDYRGGLQLDRIPAASDAAKAAHAFAALAAAGETRYRAPAIEAARFVLNLQYRPENAFPFPEIPRYLGGVRLDLHRVSAHLETTLDALEAWGAVQELLARR